MASRLSVRSRTALVAALIFGVVAALGSVVGVLLLESSLIDEIDRSNIARAQDIEIQTAGETTVPFVAAGLEPSTAAAVVDIDGEVLSSTDDLDGELLLDLYRTTAADGAFDISLPELTSVHGSETMRGITLQVDDTDEFLETFVFVASSTASVDRTIDSTRSALLFAVPLLIAVVGGLVWLMAGRALRPVERIRAEVDDITGSDLHRRVPEPGTRGEIGALAVTMNRMLERLEQASEQQRRFAADASHELRSPLASMATRLDVDLAHPDTVVWPESAAALRTDTLRMQALVDDLLVLARVSNSASETEPEPVALDDVVADAVAATMARKITIVSNEVARVDIAAHAVQLRRLLTNLLTNAARHASTCVEVQLQADQHQVILTVDDDGPGVPAEQRDHVFERFVRLDEARTRDTGGSGLGLALCREICIAHGGEIVATDSPLGGARFTVTLPVDRT